MEDKKSLVSWGLKTANGINSTLKAGRLKIQEEVTLQFKYKDRKIPMSHLKQADKNFFSLSLFVLSKSSTD